MVGNGELKKHPKKRVECFGFPGLNQDKKRSNETKVIEIGCDCGLVESKTIGIDSGWSVIKLTDPKEGKNIIIVTEHFTVGSKRGRL